MIDKALTAYCCSAGRSSWVHRNSSSRLVRRVAGQRLIKPRPRMQRAPHQTPARRESHYSTIPLFNYSIIQLFHYSTFQLLHYSIIPLFHLSTAFQLFQLFYFSTIPLIHYLLFYDCRLHTVALLVAALEFVETAAAAGSSAEQQGDASSDRDRKCSKRHTRRQQGASPIIPLFHFSTTPSFNYSIPLFHFSTTPLFNYSTIPLINCFSIIPTILLFNYSTIYLYSIIQLFHYSTFELFYYSIIRLFHFSTTPSFNYSTIPLFNYSIMVTTE